MSSTAKTGLHATIERGLPHQCARSQHRVRSISAVISFLLLLVWLGICSRPIGTYFAALGSGRTTAGCSLDERVDKILAETPLIDGHNDLAILVRAYYGNHINNKTFKHSFESGGLVGHVDLARLRQGRVGGSFWSVFWPCPRHDEDLSDEAYYSIVQNTLQQIDVMRRLQLAYPDDFAPLVLDSASALQAFKQGRLISPLGVEGLHQIGNSAATLRQFYALGARYATLTHNCANMFADAALWDGPTRKAPSFWGGVSPAGQKLIREMNRLGMIVDLAHTSEETMLDVLGGSSRTHKNWTGSGAPVIFSHSSAYALCPHPRNVKDHVLRLAKERNSLVMVNFAPSFVSCVGADNENGLPDDYPANSTLEHVVNHIMHIGAVAGFDHVGLGSDFDGIPTTPRGLEDVSKYPDLVRELLRRGVSDADAAKVVGGNILRVWREVEMVAAKMQADGEPVLEDNPAFEYSSLRTWPEP